MYAQKENDLYVNLFISSTANLVINNKQVQVVQQNNYPWEGDLRFTIQTVKANSFRLLIRIPGWALNTAVPSDLYSFQKNTGVKPTIKINGEPVTYEIQKGYAVINRAWKKNDEVLVTLPMEIRQIIANEKIKDNIGKLALQRGPIVYCAEWADNNGKAGNIIIPPGAAFSTEYKPALLNGIMTLKTEVPVVSITGTESITTEKKTVTMIPYYSWANRGKGEMTIWFPSQIKDVEILSK